MGMREKRKPENGRKPYTKPAIKREAIGKLNPFLNAKPGHDEELDRGLKQKPDLSHARRDVRRIKDTPFSPPINPGATTHDYREHSVEYDPRTEKPKYKGQKPECESSKRTVAEEALSMRRRNPILDIWNAKIDTEKGSMSGFKITPEATLDEKQRELARKIYSQEWDRLFEEERAKVPFLSRLANGKATIQRFKEGVARELGKNVADVTDEDIRKSLLAHWNFNSESKEPEKEKKTPQERFDDFMREKPK